MKKLLTLFVALFAICIVCAIAVTAVVAPSGVNLHEDTGVCVIDSAASPAGWGVPAIAGGTYGEKPYSDFCLVWEPTCAAGNELASVQLNFLGGDENILISHLDGLSNYDSFDVILDGTVVGHYTDVQDSKEIWLTTAFPVTIDAGVHTVALKVTDQAWSGCDSWGQLAIESINVETTNVPEFGLIAGGTALIGAIAGIAIIRKRN